MLSRFIGVMGAAAQLQVFDVRRTAVREWHDMVQFEECRFLAPTVRSNERTSAIITRPHRAFHARGHVTSVRVSLLGWSRPFDLRQPPSLEIFQ
jgi:hypothetical protein